MTFFVSDICCDGSTRIIFCGVPCRGVLCRGVVSSSEPNKSEVSCVCSEPNKSDNDSGVPGTNRTFLYNNSSDILL